MFEARARKRRCARIEARLATTNGSSRSIPRRVRAGLCRWEVQAAGRRPRLGRAVAGHAAPRPVAVQFDRTVSTLAAVIRRASILLEAAVPEEPVLAELAGLAGEVPGFSENLGNTAGV